MKFSLALWLFFCWLGVTLAGILVVIIEFVLWSVYDPRWRAIDSEWYLLVEGITFATMLGLFQWLALRKRVAGVALWWYATLIGGALGLMLTLWLKGVWSYPTFGLPRSLVEEPGSMWYLLSAFVHDGALGALFGVILGAAQAASTRGESISFWHWSVSNAIAWSLGFGVFVLSIIYMGYGGLIAGGLLVGAIVALITGIVVQRDLSLRLLAS